MKTLLLVLFMTGCAVGSEADLSVVKTNDIAPPTKHLSAPPDEEMVELPRVSTRIKLDNDTPECKPDVFMADAIPPGYQLDPNCPPTIIWPPSFHWPNDPGPIINPPTK